MEFRTLRADEIDVRIASIKPNGASFLLYKDARCDMRILDETVGSVNWKRSHQGVNDNMFCTVSIYDEVKKEWISKQDCGIESSKSDGTENYKKGEASDSFKRACFNWGIGRELYTSPFIWIKPNEGEEIKYAKFSVADIEYNDKREITKLVVVDKKGMERFTYGIKKYKPKSDGPKPQIKTEQSLICKKCGNEIKEARCKNGAIQTPQEVSVITNGLCIKCAKENS